MVRNLIVIGLAALACACASLDDSKRIAKADPPITPTEQFSITVTSAPDQILLAPHQNGLSDAQSDALAALVGRWRDAGAESITVLAPSAGDGQVYHSTQAIEAALEELGVDPGRIKLGGYDAGPRAGAPIAVGFKSYKAEGPECGREWKSFTASHDNNPNSNFGCATTANIAAMIADPADLLAPRQASPADAGRRETVMTKYRQGATTSTAKDPQANGAVSDAVQQ
ncbi:MAG TPA: CpaD family pilus assembly protein [Caulobacteraceae bacterium]|jgi:pilus assembly protein CpaD|nr:CpaD family pilus assembly protein [Caulobacteraceae bacterium]